MFHLTPPEQPKHPRRRAADREDFLAGDDHLSHRPEGVSEDEARWYSQQRQADIRYALKHYSRRATTWFAILTVAAILNGVYTSQQSGRGRDAIVTSGRVVSVAGCNRDYQDREKFRELLIRLKQAARASAAADPNADPERLRAALDFYNDQLKAYPSLDCRASAKVITDDPTKLPKTPEPCFKGNPNNPEGCQPPAPSGSDRSDAAQGG